MNILIIIPQWSYRGGEKIFLKLGKLLKEENNNVLIIAGRKDGKNFQSNLGLKIIYPKSKLLKNDLFYFLFSWVFLLRLALKQNRKFDWIITESNQCLWVASLYSVLKKTKVAWYVMAYEGRHFKNPFYNFLYEASFGNLERLCLTRVDKVFALAPRVKRSLIKKYGREVKLLFPVVEKTNVDLKKVDSKLKSLAKNKKLLFLPAAFHWKKNQKLAIKLISKLPNEFHLVLAGSGKDRNNLQLIINNLKVNNQTHFVGVLGTNDMGYMYKNSYLTLVCSLNENEGLSLTAIESLMQGGKVLVSSKAGVAELIKSHSDVVVASPNLKSFTKALYNEIG